MFTFPACYAIKANKEVQFFFSSESNFPNFDGPIPIFPNSTGRGLKLKKRWKSLYLAIFILDMGKQVHWHCLQRSNHYWFNPERQDIVPTSKSYYDLSKYQIGNSIHNRTFLGS